ncbi:MAG: ABC transporter ATP-binding protein [Candidatus Zixiibacteriota bacterium]
MYSLTSGAMIYLASALPGLLYGAEAVSTAPTDALTNLGFFDGLRTDLNNFVTQLLMSNDREANLRNLCIALVLITIAKNLFLFLQGFFTAYVEQGITKRFRDQIYNHLQKLSLSFFHRSRTGNLISITMNDVQKIHETLNNTINNLIRDPLQILVFLGFMIAVSWQLTLITIAVLALIFLSIYQVGKLIRRYSLRAQEAISEVSTTLEETINAIRIVRAYAAEPFEIKKFNERTRNYFRTMLKINRVRLISGPINELLGVTAVVIVLWWGGRAVLSAGALQPNDLMLYILAMFSIINPAKSVSSLHVKLNEGMASAQRIFDLLDVQPRVVEPERPIEIASFEREIVFDNVGFEYNEGEPVLQDISFKVKKGQIIALVGPSGSGKSTLVDLLCRFDDPGVGAIKIDGHNLRDLSMSSLRGLLGVVTQETILFNDSIRNNIAYPETDKDDGRLQRAAKAANAYNFVMEMPNQFDTVIGNRGMMVSGGERQRLAIARALMKDPEILIFDEATSALDTESERLVQEAIDRLMAGRTAIVIAHRLSTILHADLILVLKDGRVVERGRHDELLRVGGVYRRLYDMQFERNDATKAGAESA